MVFYPSSQLYFRFVAKGRGYQRRDPTLQAAQSEVVLVEGGATSLPEPLLNEAVNQGQRYLRRRNFPYIFPDI